MILLLAEINESLGPTEDEGVASDTAREPSSNDEFEWQRSPVAGSDEMELVVRHWITPTSFEAVRATSEFPTCPPTILRQTLRKIDRIKVPKHATIGEIKHQLSQIKSKKCLLETTTNVRPSISQMHLFLVGQDRELEPDTSELVDCGFELLQISERSKKDEQIDKDCESPPPAHLDLFVLVKVAIDVISNPNLPCTGCADKSADPGPATATARKPDNDHSRASLSPSKPYQLKVDFWTWTHYSALQIKKVLVRNFPEMGEQLLERLHVVNEDGHEIMNHGAIPAHLLFLKVWVSEWAVKVRALAGEVYTIGVDPLDRPKTLIDAVFEKTGIRGEDHVYMTTDGAAIGLSKKQQSTLLKDLGVVNGCTLYLLPRKSFASNNLFDGNNYPVYNIAKAEHRGICLVQLRALAVAILRGCKAEGWTSTNPTHNGKLLTPEEVTLYDLMEHYIRPLTKELKCSYVELVAQSEEQQIPQFFCSHWWGESVFQFLACLEQHASDRNISDTTPYWICAYALNQHDMCRELNAIDPRATPFYRAMQLTKGTVSVIDRNATYFTRIWCSFEIATVMNEMKQRRVSDLQEQEEQEQQQQHKDSYFYDIYTLTEDDNGVPGVPVGLIDGVTAADDVRLLSGTSIKQYAFPLLTCHKALRMQLENASATEPSDRAFILNSIIGNTEQLWSDPPESHSAYNHLNACLRGRLSESIYRVALELGDDNMEHFRKALAEAPFPQLAMSFSSCSAFKEEAKHFAQALPASLQILELDMSGIQFETLEDFVFGLERLGKLTRLKLTAMGCCLLKDVTKLWGALGKLPLLKELRLNFFGCRQLSSDALHGCREPLSSLDFVSLNFSNCNLSTVPVYFGHCSNISALFLDFSLNEKLRSLDELGEALPTLPHLQRLDLSCSHCAEIASVTTLAYGLKTSRNLSVLKLDLKGCKNLDCIDAIGETIRHLPAMVELTVSVENCNNIHSISSFVDALASGFFPFLECLSLSCAGNANISLAVHEFVSGTRMPKLKALRLDFAECKGVHSAWVPVYNQDDRTLLTLAVDFRTMYQRHFDSLYLDFSGTCIAEQSVTKLLQEILYKCVRVQKRGLYLRFPGYGSIRSMTRLASEVEEHSRPKGDITIVAAE